MTQEELLASLPMWQQIQFGLLIDKLKQWRESDHEDFIRICRSDIISIIDAVKVLSGSAQTAGHWAIQESVPSDGFECYFLLRDGITVAEICGPQSDQRLRDLSDLVSAANASASGGDAVAWTNEAQLGFLKDPTCADIPMAMWAKHGRAATIPLYAAPQQSPRLEREWQPIETAPRDGTSILAIRRDWWEPVNGNHRWVFGRVYESYFDAITDRFESNGLKQPTHWMPLPAAPEQTVVPSTDRAPIAGASDRVDEAACLIWSELCPGLIMGDNDRPHYENAARAVLALRGVCK